MRRHAKAADAGSTKRRAKTKPALLACALAACVAALALVVGSASGSTTRFLQETFGSSAQPSFPADRGIVVDQSTNEVYVLDATEDTLYRYNADGSASNFSALGSNAIDGEGSGDETPQVGLSIPSSRKESQIAIDESGTATDGDIYVAGGSAHRVDIFDSAGEYKGQLTEYSGGALGETCGVAVDGSGNVYVGDYSHGVHVYEPAANPPVNGDNSATFTTAANPCTLAAGAGASEGFLFVDRYNGELKKLDAATGEVKYTLASGGSTVSVDPSSGHVFSARNTGGSSTIDEYDASGASEASLVSSFKPGSTAEGVAANGASEEVYVSRSGTENVEVYGAAKLVPDVVTEAVSNNTGVHATLNGTVNPDGVELSECFFEWGIHALNGAQSYGNIAPCAESNATIGSGTSPVTVHAELSALTPQTTSYSFRLVAKNPGSPAVNGSNQNFATPDTVFTEAATGISPTEATLNGTVNPDGVALTECVFEYGPPKEYGETVQQYTDSVPCVPGPGGIGAGSSPVAVSAGLSGLDVGGVYHYRLKAANANGPILGADQSVLTGGPVIAAWSENVVYTEATLKAEVNPKGQATTYHFEYGTTAAYGQNTPELPAGSDNSIHEMTRFLEGLSPATTYHYRVVATNSTATNEGPDRTFNTYTHVPQDTSCQNQAFRIGPAATLPDCRAYEMVSPVDKNGGDILLAPDNTNMHHGFMASSVNGGKLTYTARPAFGDEPSSLFSNQYLATRQSQGWISKGINAPQGRTLSDPLYNLGEVAAKRWGVFTPDLSSGWVYDYNYHPLTPDGQEGHINLYRRDNAADSYEALTVSAPTVAINNEMGIQGVEGVSADGSHAVFSAAAALTPSAASNTQRQIYEFSDGKLHLVSVLPDGSADPSADGVGAANGTVGRGDLARAVSADGSRVVWTSRNAPWRIFVRENADQEQSAFGESGECSEPAKACTVPVSESVATGSATYRTASVDGSKVVFSFGVGAGGEDLYVFDVPSKTPTLVAHGVEGVVGGSEDLAYLYFISKDAVAAGATAGEHNLYLDHEGQMTFIGALSDVDMGTTSAFTYTVGGVQPSYRASRVTPDGRHLAFNSTRSLTGYDNTDVKVGQADVEVFIYDADHARLTCASCNPSGGRPAGENLASPYVYPAVAKAIDYLSNQWAAAWIPTWENPLYPSRVLSDDGSRLFFHSSDALVPRDTNGVRDLYQWEAGGAHGCGGSEGCISLISSGESAGEAEFIDASPSGNDVFFSTSRSLRPEDPGSIDIYDARAGGGYPVPPNDVAPCVGDACQSIPRPPAAASAASAGFRGAGTVRSGGSQNCSRPARRAVRMRLTVKRLRRAIRRHPHASHAKRLRRRSMRAARRVRALNKRAIRCRRANRRAH